MPNQLSYSIRFLNCLLVASSLLIIIQGCKTKKNVVTVPKKAEVTDTSHVEVIKEEPVIKEHSLTLNINFIGPFNFAQINGNTTSPDEKDAFTPQTLTALSFFEGMKLFADSFEKHNIEWKIKSFDSKADSILVASQLSLDQTYDCDILISNIQNSYYPTLQSRAATKWCKIISLNNTSTTYENTFYLLPTNTQMIDKAADYISSHFSKDNIICLYKSENSKEKELAGQFLKNIIGRSEKRMVHPLAYNEKRKDSLLSMLSTERPNLLLMATSDEALVTSIFKSLQPQLDKYRITVFGMPTWEHFESIDFSTFELFKTEIFLSQFIDYDNTDITQLRKSYIARYYTEPGYTVITGFYLAKALNDLIRDHGKDYWGRLNSRSDHFNPNYFHVESVPGKSSFINQKVFILKYKDYKLVTIN